MNPHIEKAQTLLTAAKTSYATEFKTANAAQAHAEASLAIAHEARTANLIAFVSFLESANTANHEAIIEEIAELLDCNLIER